MSIDITILEPPGISLTINEQIIEVEISDVSIGFQGPAGAAGAAGVGVPTGGTAGQVLAKLSGTNYDTAWQDASTGGGVSVGLAAGLAIALG